MDIKSLINKVITSKGILRVPSWWMKKLLTEIVGYIDSGDSANSKSVDKAKSYADSKITNLESEIKFDLLNLKKSLHTQKCFVVKTGASAGYVVVDGVTQDIPANTQKIITFTDTFRFSPDSGYRNQPIEFIGLAVTDVSTMTSMNSMFSQCTKLTSIDLSGLDTSAVTDMKYMFFQDSGLTSIDLSGLNTSSVTDMNSMFYYCRHLTSLDLSGFDTSKVKDMCSMFAGCSSLTSIDLSGLNTSSVTDMNSMFSSCGNLKSLNLSGFDTSKVKDMSYMFDGCSSLTSIDLSGLNTSSVTDMYRMFAYCGDLKSLNLSGFDTSAVTDMSDMFSYSRSLISLLLGPNFFKTSAVTSIDFSNCSKWTNDTVVTSLVTNSYDRASASLNTLTLQLHSNTKAALSDEQKAAITSKGYTIA